MLQVLAFAFAAQWVLVDGACPTDELVGRRLTALLGDGVVPAAPVAKMRPGVIEGVALEVGTGVQSVRRQLPSSTSCEQRAQIAATVIAAWYDNRHAPLFQPTVRSIPLDPAPRNRRVDVEGSVAFVASLGGSDFAPALLADVRLAPRDWKLGFFIGLLGEFTRELQFTGGPAAWGRSGLSLGVGYRFAFSRMRLDLRAEGMPALVYTSVKEHARFNEDFGLGGGVRLGVQLGPVRPFVSANVLGWLRSVPAKESLPNALPRFEVLLSVGLAFGAGN